MRNISPAEPGSARRRGLLGLAIASGVNRAFAHASPSQSLSSPHPSPPTEGATAMVANGLLNARQLAIGPIAAATTAGEMPRLAAALPYGTWRNLYATGMAERIAGEQLAGRAGIALRVAGALTAAVSGGVAAMDLADANRSRSVGKYELAGLQLLSGLAGIAAAVFSILAGGSAGSAAVVGGLSVTGWGVLLAIVLVALAMAIDHIRGDAFAQWLERCYWGTLDAGRYSDPDRERTDFNKAMTGFRCSPQ